MKRELFAISSYCIIHNIDYSFISSLQNEGLIQITLENEDEFIDAEQLPELETYTRWHHELGINPEGIDAIRHLVHKIRDIQAEIQYLKSRLKLYEPEDE